MPSLTLRRPTPGLRSFSTFVYRWPAARIRELREQGRDRGAVEIAAPARLRLIGEAGRLDLEIWAYPVEVALHCSPVFQMSPSRLAKAPLRRLPNLLPFSKCRCSAKYRETRNTGNQGRNRKSRVVHRQSDLAHSGFCPAERLPLLLSGLTQHGVRYDAYNS